MSRLFLKVFAWFLLAQLFLGFVIYQVMAVVRPQVDGNRWRNFTNSTLQLQAHAAAIIYERQGVEGLKGELTKLKSENQPVIYAFDGAGKNLTGSNLSPDIRDLAVRAARTTTPEFTFEGDRLYTASSVKLNNGQPFVLVAQIQRSPGTPNRDELRRRRRRMARGPSPTPLVDDLRDPSGLGLIRIAALLVTSGLVCYGLAVYLVSPAIKLRRATHQLASGDLSARVAAQMGRRRDELADLGRDFDQMAERIESLMLSERRLLADISHELRSPLARLTVALDLADGSTDPQTQAYLERIRLESERLNEMIGQLLSLSRLESGSARVETTPVHLTDLVREVAHDADFEASMHNRSIELKEVDDCWTSGDVQLLRSAIENVVRNGLKYTAENTAVELTLRCGEVAKSAPGSSTGGALLSTREAIITVRDHGPGVPPGALDKLFRPFYRVADARDRQSGGTGLGLAISERAVRFHGGRITAENHPEGGLLITLHLPIKETK